MKAPAQAGSFAPEDPEGYRFLLGHFQRKGDADAAYRAALCLDALGEADVNESLLVAQHRPEGLQPVRASLSYADWNERLCVGLEDSQLLGLLRSIAFALPRIGFQHARRMHRERSLPDEARQEIEKSTTMLAKSLHWGSRLLCVPVSELYVLPELPGAIELVPGEEQPAIACSRSLGSGFELPELVCLWARELAFLRREQAALCYFPDANELVLLLQGALAVGGATSMRSIDEGARRIASGLKREVRGAELAALELAAQSFVRQSPGGADAAELGLRALAFMRCSELVAARVALVASGRLDLALACSARFPRGIATRPSEQRADLLRFAVSAEFGRIRSALGVAIG